MGIARVPIRLGFFVCALLGVCLLPIPARGEEAPLADARLGKLQDLNGPFPFVPPTSEAEWSQRRTELRRQLLVATGLWPMPKARPPQAVAHSPVQREGYTVERVILESYPGHYVTGSLYRPPATNEATGKRAAVLCPYGHYPGGRFHENDAAKIKKLLAGGEEKYEIGGTYPLQAMCVQLVRMGCVVFQWDLVGYADSVQIPELSAHRVEALRQEMDTDENWGFFSVQAELRLQSVTGVQTYNELKVLDWICTLPDVDEKRIGVAGHSSGGTQTFVLCALDERPATAFPAGMVSTTMQGGCSCENCSHLRVGTSNVELAALIAPRPLGMAAANDWTKDIQTQGLPELKQLYAMLHAPNDVAAYSFNQFGHQFNYVSRAPMYEWMNKYLRLGMSGPIVEQDFVPLSKAETTVWDEKHPRPEGGDAVERKLLRDLTIAQEEQFQELIPHDAASLAEYRRVVGGGWSTLVGRGLPRDADVELEIKSDTELEKRAAKKLSILVRNKKHHEEFPCFAVHPYDPQHADDPFADWNGEVIMWLDERGKRGLFDSQGELIKPVKRALEKKYAVVAPDLFQQGDFLPDDKTLFEAPQTPGKKKALAYTMCYNASLSAQRTHDVLTILAAVKSSAAKPERIHLLALSGSAPWAAAAVAQAPGLCDKIAIHTDGFRYRSLNYLRDTRMWPGAVRYGDLPGLLALAAPQKLWLAGEVPPGEVTLAAYKAAGAADKLTTVRLPTDQWLDASLDWIMAP